ncbi:hypothetical protein JYU34_013387 [Plutella xylostella]|uniref:FP protein C-terminal domain-containing protein n=2 Tax=Plutella xylostella TaxID=51655 RepID=A0ABQ7Q9N2_PLUXY|nr:hypothetical protein JYU34_013387 [Plutella xylostella]
MYRSPGKSGSYPNVSKLDDVAAKPCPITARTKRRRSIESPSDTFEDRLHELAQEIKTEIKDMFDQFAREQNKNSNSILTTLKDIQQTNLALQSSITFLSEENIELKNKLNQMEQQSMKDREQIFLLESKFEDSQRTERKSNIEIKNVPLIGKESKNDLQEMLFRLSENLNIKIEKPDIKDIIKINKNKKEKSTVIVEFTNTYAKTEIMKAAKNYNAKNKQNKLCAAHLGLKTDADAPIYISENLTPKASRLYFLARDLKAVKNYKYCWTSYGKVYLRQNDDSPIITLTNEAQIQQLSNK